ncbi:MAG: winged helix-turn-helix domain-containing protein [Acidobacteriota bacterium]
MDKNHNIFEFGDVRVEPSKFKIWKAGAELALEPKTFQVLLFLLENRGRLVEKNELLDAVWQDTFVTENAMTREIAKLRKALGDDAKETKYIQTVHTRGYRFIAEVREIAETQAGEAESLTEANNDKIAAAETKVAPTNAAPKNCRSLALKLSALFAALALAAAGVWLIRARYQSFAVVNVQRVAQITNWSGLDDFPSLAPDGNTVAYCSDHNGSFQIYVKQLTPGANEIQLTNDGGQNFQPAWSPDGQRIAYYSKLRGGIWIIPASGGEARQMTDFGSHPAWSPDGKQIAFQSNSLNDLGAYARNSLPPSTLWLVAADGGEPKQLTQIGNPAGGHGSPSFSPDGSRIVFEVDDYNNATVWTISTGGDDAKKVTQAEKRGDYEPVYAPDGKSIIYAGGKVGGLFQVRVNPDTSEPIGEPAQIAEIGGTFSGIRRVSFSADGKKITYSALLRREGLSSVRLQTNSGEADGTPAPLVQNTNDRNNFPTYSPDGRRIAFSTCNIGGTNCNIWLINADGGNQTQLTTNGNDNLIPSWFPDMEQIAHVSKHNGHWTLWAINLNTKREKMLLDLTDDLEYVRLSPDGKQIVFNFKRGSGGVINVWTTLLADGEPKQLTFDKELMGFPCWSPDGKYIAFQMKRGDDTHIMIMPREGGTPTQLTFDKGQSWNYDWSPDGDKILFAGQRDGIWNVWSVSRSTKKQQQLTNYTKLNSFVRYPSWSPLGNQVVYEYSETTGNIWVADLK